MEIEEKIDETLNSIKNLDEIKPDNNSIENIFIRLEEGKFDNSYTSKPILVLVVFIMLILNFATIFSNQVTSEQSENIKTVIAKEYFLNYLNERRL